MTDLIQTTEKNLMKRNVNSGYDTMNGPNFNYFSVMHSSEHHVPHHLGYVPLFRAFYEPWGDGKIVQAGHPGDQLFYPPYDLGGAIQGPVLSVYADEEELVFVMVEDQNRGTTQYPIYWVIYDDYELDP